jgi:hypothetical protein
MHTSKNTKRPPAKGLSLSIRNLLLLAHWRVEALLYSPPNMYEVERRSGQQSKRKDFPIFSFHELSFLKFWYLLLLLLLLLCVPYAI